MKTKILILAFACLTLGTHAQQKILTHYSWLTPTSLPYYDNYYDKVLGNQRIIGFPYGFWTNNPLNTNVWKDLGLTSIFSEPTEGWNVCDLYRTFTPTNGSYKLCAVNIGCFDYGKTMLISINNSGNYIDAIDVSAILSGYPNSKWYYPLQWKLDSDMKVTVYQLKPTSGAPLLCNNPITFPLQAQRIDKVYQISPTGQFSLISTKTYQPKSYTLSNFSDPSYNIWNGNETPQ